MVHSPIHDAVIPPSLFLEGNSPESKSSKDVNMSSPTSFLSDYSVGSPHGFASPLKTRREAFLLKNYLQDLAPRVRDFHSDNMTSLTSHLSD
ncbi:uncharacterized protein FTOL_13690 [Fusarium torulosum]|uniref:Uncharacterized protein n=1 Tax=Fusarium torulosum TaxID=33205 RepID=A0AAE8MMV6_9HYPO|nr:uncharacterized protein FTOL_13690 [Fusarium torulosum]